MLGKLYLISNDSGLRILDDSAIHILYGTIADNRHGMLEWVIGRPRDWSRCAHGYVSSLLVHGRDAREWILCYQSSQGWLDHARATVKHHADNAVASQQLVLGLKCRRLGFIGARADCMVPSIRGRNQRLLRGFPTMLPPTIPRQPPVSLSDLPP